MTNRKFWHHIRSGLGAAQAARSPYFDLVTGRAASASAAAHFLAALNAGHEAAGVSETRLIRTARLYMEYMAQVRSFDQVAAAKKLRGLGG